MSSARFEAILRPESRLRGILLVCAVAALFAGIAMLWSLPFAAGWRLLACAAWTADGLYGAWRLIRGARRVRRFRIDADGGLFAEAPDGRLEPLRLLPGSQVLPRLAWLRVSFPEGSRYVELLARPDDDQDWQRFQLIWRLRRGAFGGPRLS